MFPMANTRLLTVVVTDLVGSTDTIARLGAEAGESWRKAHLELLRAVLSAAGGREIQHTGDGLLLAFESASQAVACTKAMQERVARASGRRDALAPLSVRIGIAVGEVSEDAEGVHGLVVVEAARLCAAAKGGQVLATALVQALCAGHSEHQFASVGSLELKGLPAPVAAVEVACAAESTSGVPFPLRLGELGQGAFVGRTAERESLAAAWRDACQGQRKIALLAGEPGIGKTRLAAELAREAHAAGIARPLRPLRRGPRRAVSAVGPGARATTPCTPPSRSFARSSKNRDPRWRAFSRNSRGASRS